MSIDFKLKKIENGWVLIFSDWNVDPSNWRQVYCPTIIVANQEIEKHLKKLALKEIDK